MPLQRARWRKVYSYQNINLLNSPVSCVFILTLVPSLLLNPPSSLWSVLKFKQAVAGWWWWWVVVPNMSRSPRVACLPPGHGQEQNISRPPLFPASSGRAAATGRSLGDCTNNPDLENCREILPRKQTLAEPAPALPPSPPPHMLRNWPSAAPTLPRITF